MRKFVLGLIVVSVVCLLGVSYSISGFNTSQYIDFLLDKDKEAKTPEESYEVTMESVSDLVAEFNEFRTVEDMRSDEFIYELTQFFINEFDYELGIEDPSKAVLYRSGNCTALSLIYKEMLKFFGRDYFVTTGGLGDTLHMWVTIKDEEGDYMISDMSQAVSGRDVKYGMVGLRPEYTVEYCDYLISLPKNWEYGDKNIFYLGELYILDEDELYYFKDGKRVPIAKNIEDIYMHNGTLLVNVDNTTCSVSVDKSFLSSIYNSKKYIYNEWEGE